MSGKVNYPVKLWCKKLIGGLARMFRFGGAEEKVENLEREGGLGIDHQVGC
jgi:hypothetical protein